MKNVTIYEYTTERYPDINYILESEYSVCVSTNGDSVFYYTFEEAKHDLEDVTIGYGYSFDDDEEWLANHVGTGALLWYRSL